MKRITTLLGSSLGVTLLWLCAAAASAQPAVGPAPEELDPKVVEAWQKAGAEVGWYGQDEIRFLAVFRGEAEGRR